MNGKFLIKNSLLLVAAVSAVAGILGGTILLASITSLRHVRSAKMNSSESNS